MWAIDKYNAFFSMISKINNLHCIVMSMNSHLFFLKQLQLPQNSTLIFQLNHVLDIAALISQVDCVFSPDTAIPHIAQCFNKPLLTIYSSEFFCKEWTVSDDLSDYICSSPGNSPATIPAEDVYQKFIDMLNRCA